jgi:hypothetical protein
MRELVEQNLDKQSELDRQRLAKLLPTSATYTRRLQELQKVLQPDQKRNHIHALNHLEVQLETVIALVATFYTDELVQHEFVESMLREVANLLDHTLEVVREQVAAIQGSNPQTSGTL